MLLAACLSLLASLSAASCGSAEEEGIAESSPTNLNIVTESDLARYPRNSPERALLMWFQAVQFRDQDAVRLHTTDSAVVPVGSKTLAEAVKLIGSFLGKPRIVSTRVRGKGAVVRIFIQSWEPDNATPVLEIPRSFTLLRVGGRWKLSDLSYLMETRAEILAQRRASD